MDEFFSQDGTPNWTAIWSHSLGLDATEKRREFLELVQDRIAKHAAKLTLTDPEAAYQYMASVERAVSDFVRHAKATSAEIDSIKFDVARLKAGLPLEDDEPHDLEEE